MRTGAAGVVGKGGGGGNLLRLRLGRRGGAAFLGSVICISAAHLGAGDIYLGRISRLQMRAHVHAGRMQAHVKLLCSAYLRLYTRARAHTQLTGFLT